MTICNDGELKKCKERVISLQNEEWLLTNRLNSIKGKIEKYQTEIRDYIDDSDDE